MSFYGDTNSNVQVITKHPSFCKMLPFFKNVVVTI